MTVAWSAAAGAHAVQFYDDERFLHRAIAAFFAEGLDNGEPLVMIARPQTFEAVVEHVASARGVSPIEAVSRILFVDVATARHEFLNGVTPDPARLEQSVSRLLAGARRGGQGGTIWLYGETVDVLCKEGHYAAAARLEELWNTLFIGPGMSVLCGYAIDNFDDDVSAKHLRAICGQHTYVFPTEGIMDAPDDRTRFERIAILQHSARALGRLLASESPAPAGTSPATTTPTVYIVDDDASVRRSLGRLIASADFRVQTFASAEAFLAEVDETSSGCLIVDVQLIGMTGPDLQRRMARSCSPMPIIAMSGSDDVQFEMDALRLGARAFLRKPFDTQTLIQAITRALS
jgi:CheY-like chemotaxis protein